MKNRRPILWFGLIIFVAVFGGVAVGGTVSGITASRRAPHETATATGTVTKAGHCGRTTTDGRAVFTVNGTEYGAGVSCKARLGAHVPVRYQPSDPAHNNDANSSLKGYVLAGLAVVGLAIGLPRPIRELRRAPRRASGRAGAGTAA